MKEDLLQYIWQQKTLLKLPLQTTSGKPITVIKPGRLNLNAGPDFFDARVKIDDTLWVGNIEIHINSSDWVKHHHNKNPSYNNVILHVVFNDDVPLNIPTLELKNYLSTSFIDTYKSLLQSSLRIPCQKIIALPDDLVLQQFLHRLVVGRLENKCALLEEQLLIYQNSWEKLFYITLAKYFGMNVNAEPFQQLAQSLPQQLLAKHKYSSSQIDALIFGVAGFLPAKTGDDYTNILNREFDFLKTKYGLHQLPIGIWKFAKTRPSNFPTVRLAQFSALVFQSVHLFSKLMDTKSIEEAEVLFMIHPSKFLVLNNLYNAQHPPLKGIGKQTIQHLLINVVVPFKFIYGKHMLNEALCEQAIDWLEKLPAENNNITKFWSTIGFKAQQALHSQALIELNNNYCTKHQCLSCSIGSHILYRHA